MIGQTIAHYTIVEKLGEGGMGVVYKARDNKLDRFVALKFIPPGINVSDGDELRFVQEAKAASALNHPNVCTIHDIQEYDLSPGSGKQKQLFIVMEYVDGQTLGSLMNTAPEKMLPLKRTLEIAIQIADGLAAAHEKGIVHRDIKPDNIMIRKDGIVQIMDFGLAKLRDRGSAITRLTKQGTTVGTAGYMSPEQVQGQDTDHRSDIFSYGVVLYELLTGRLPFNGVHETALAYEIVNVDPPPMSSLCPEVGQNLDAIVFECLEKDVNERAQSIRQISVDLKRHKRESSRQRVSRITAVRPIVSMRQPAIAGEHPAGAGEKYFWYILSGILALAVILLVIRPWNHDNGTFRSVMRFSINLPDNALIWGGAGITGLAVSADGRSVAYISHLLNSNQIYLHRMDQSTSQPVPGTENPSEPAFSPDGQWIVFNSANQKLVKVSVSGGAPEVLCSIQGQTRGISWTTENTILFGTISDGIFSVPSAGGTPVPVTMLDSAGGEISHRFPQLIDGGKAVLFTVKQNMITTFDDAIIAAQRLGTGERKILVRGGTYARYIPTGYLTYIHDNTIFAVHFDPERLEVRGSPVAIETGVWMFGGSGQANVDFSQSGLLVYAPAGSQSENTVSIVSMDQSGKTYPLLDTLRPYHIARISPDGTKIATTINAANDDIWVYHIARGVLARLTFGGGNNDFPVWSPDGKYVYYGAEKSRSPNIFRKPWDGSGPEQRMALSTNSQRPVSFNSDGTALSFNQDGDIWILPVDSASSGTNQKPWTFINSPANEGGGQFSPDGRWMAYRSDESGKNEVYVTTFPRHDGKWQISNGGGIDPLWSPDGKKLFYTNGSVLMAVDVLATMSFDFSVPRKVCDIPPSVTLQDISHDGTQFIAAFSHSQQLTFPRLEVVVGWFEEVKNKVSGLN